MTRLRSPDTSSLSQLIPYPVLRWIFTLTILGLFIVVLFNSQSTLPAPDSFVSNCFSPQLQESLYISEEIYRKYREKREKIIQSHPKRIDPWKSYVYPYDYFLATFNCPYMVQRIGPIGDGGKWVCGIERYQDQDPSSPSCVLYSFGISTETNFEIEILQTTNCEIFAYDASVDKVIGIPEEYKSRVHFFKLFGGDENTEKVTTLGEAMAKNGHDHIDILKMDVEKAEYKMIPQILSEFGKDNLPFGQLLIEIHATITSGSDFAKLYDFFISLENVGLRPFRNELNIAPYVGKKPNLKAALSEYSFLNINKMCLT